MASINNLYTDKTKGDFLVQVDQVVMDNLSNTEFSVDQLKQHLFLCSSQIYRKIKQQTGASPSVYIRTIRLHHAHDLIKKSDLTLSQIALKVGFNGLPYFSRCFMSYYGCRPSMIRE